MKQVKLSITETYVAHWSWWQGVREILQNAVDTKDYDIIFGEDNLRVISRGGKIPMNALLLGKTTKSSDDTTIGKFGEGMKLGFLVLKRLGAGVVVNNEGDLWSPEMVYDELFEEHVLAVNIEEGCLIATPNTVEIGINNIPAEVIEEIKSKFAPCQNRKVVIENARGKAYAKDGYHRNCRLFVKGIFVTEVPGKFKFDYDFMPQAFVLDRDRDTASTFEVKYEAANLIRLSDDIMLLAELAMENFDDLVEFRGQFAKRRPRNSGLSYDEDYDEDSNPLAEKAAELFEKKHGRDAFPISQVWDAAKKRVVIHQVIKAGLVPVEVNSALFSMIEDEYRIEENLEHFLDFDALDFLEKFLHKHRRKMYSKAIRELTDTIEVLKAVKG